MTPEQLSVREAARRGVERVRDPRWSHPMDHLRIDLMGDGKMGPWLHLYSPFNGVVNQRDPVDLLVLAGTINLDNRCLTAYAGPLPESQEYRDEVQRISEVWR